MGDPTWAGGDGEPPKNLNLGEEGFVHVKDGDQDKIVGTLKDKVSLTSTPIIPFVWNE